MCDEEPRVVMGPQPCFKNSVALAVVLRHSSDTPVLDDTAPLLQKIKLGDDVNLERGSEDDVDLLRVSPAIDASLPRKFRHLVASDDASSHFHVGYLLPNLSADGGIPSHEASSSPVQDPVAGP